MPLNLRAQTLTLTKLFHRLSWEKNDRRKNEKLDCGHGLAQFSEKSFNK